MDVVMRSAMVALLRDLGTALAVIALCGAAVVLARLVLGYYGPP